MTRFRILGCGWSHGVPVIGCTCKVCTGGAPRNLRSRPALHVEHGDTSVVIDVGPDFRNQVLAAGIDRLDAALITHAHADHVMGLDDLRRFTWRRPSPLGLYADPDTLERVKILLPYAGQEPEPGKAVPLLEFVPWTQPVEIGALTFTPFRVPHGGMACLGIRIDSPEGSVGYVPDCSDLPAEVRPLLEGLDVMILNALRLSPHPSHLSLEQSLALLSEVDAHRSILTHLGCPIDYDEVNPSLPDGMELAYDGMEIRL